MDQRRKEGINFNRDLLLQVAPANGLGISNTRFQKPDNKLICHRNIGVNHGPPWTPVRYGTADHFLINRRWKNMAKDVETRTDIALPTDHYILITRCRMNLKAMKKQPTFATLPCNVFTTADQADRAKPQKGPLS